MAGNTRYARYNRTALRGVVHEADGRVFTLEVRADGTIDGPKPPPNGLHLTMWLQPSFAKRVEDPGDSPDYAKLQARMRFDWQMEQLMQPFVIALDGGRPMSLREMAAVYLERAMESAGEEALARFREIVLETPIPDDASTRDAPLLPKAAALLAQAVARHGHVPFDPASPN